MPVSAVFNLNSPGGYLSWHFISISISNFVLIFSMLIIFGLSLLIPFPRNNSDLKYEDSEADSERGDINDSAAEGVSAEDQKLFTYKMRKAIRSNLPLDKLIPDRQPAYVESWIYVFGVATLVALSLVIASGVLLALGGVDWWHTTSLGHFVNSLHLWSVECFMAFMVIHLWGKFWMAAWRKKRALTWMTGVIAFMFSVIEAFTGYLSQQNFDSQWISTNGKDAFNAVGVGSFFNLMNFGQMLTLHIVVIPLVLVLIVGIHVIAVRYRGVVVPLGSEIKEKRIKANNPKFKLNVPYKRYDIIKEGMIAGAIVLVLVVVLAVAFSSPDMPPLTIKTWANIAPNDFVATAASELAGTSETANYGPPYNNGSKNVQSLLFSEQKLIGVREPINPAQSFVITPLKDLAPTNDMLAKAISAFVSATPRRQNIWATNYLNNISSLKFINLIPVLKSGNYGPVPVLMEFEFQIAKNGLLDGELIANREFYGNNFTKPLLFLEDGQYFSSIAQKQHLIGSQWGVMNESGSYPGQPWLWLYSLWYQLPGFRNSTNVDLIAVYITGLATALLLFVPFIPGIRDIPRYIPIHKLVWKRWYKEHDASESSLE